MGFNLPILPGMHAVPLAEAVYLEETGRDLNLLFFPACVPSHGATLLTLALGGQLSEHFPWSFLT